VKLLEEWSETFPYDFKDERVMAHVREIAQKCVSIENEVREEVSLLLQSLGTVRGIPPQHPHRSHN
jgi:hypothetical protein